MSEPYTSEWYADLMDRTEARYCEADMDKLRAENEALRAALKWYAEGGSNWDRGKRARAALNG